MTITFPGLKIVEFNPTDLCNRTCSFCPRANPDVYPNRNLNMNVATVEHVVEDLVRNRYTGKVVFSGWGEPTLNRDIVMMIRKTSCHFVTHLVTNGDKILQDEWYTLEQFVDAGLKEMYVDVYDDQTQYHAWLKKTEPYKHRIKFTISPKYDLQTHPIKIYVNRAGMVSHSGIPSEGSNRKCYTPSTKAFIDWDGTLLLCCHDWSRSVQFGNVNQQPLSVLWTSERMMQVRKELYYYSRQKNGAPCSNCNANGNTQDLPHLEKVWPQLFTQ